MYSCILGTHLPSRAAALCMSLIQGRERKSTPRATTLTSRERTHVTPSPKPHGFPASKTQHLHKTFPLVPRGLGS